MASGKHIVLSCWVALSLCIASGCSKKNAEEKPQGTTTAQTQETQTQQTQVAPAQAASTQAVSTQAAVPQVTTIEAAPVQSTPTQATAAKTPTLQSSLSEGATVDLQKSIADLQTAAQTMSLDTLKATALKYKEAILSKQADAEKLLTEAKALSVTDALGEKGKALKSDLQSLQATVSALKERYQVYYNAMKEKGADLSGIVLSK